MTIAIVGRTGSGKTYAAKGMVETRLGACERVCIVDPTGAWWGLRLAADGAAAGFPVVIFGGDHADVPITAEHGECLAGLIAGGDVAQCVVDVSDMSGGEQTRFLTAFLERLYAANRSRLVLVLDEADVMAPQNPLPEQRRLQGATNKIVRRGRIKGFAPIMITQRPAVLDKSVLSQVDTLVAMRLTSPQDRKAIEEWVKGNADAGEARRVLDTLAALPRGEGWYWAPADGVLERRQFPPISTFDSSRAPEPGEVARDVSTTALADIEKLKSIFLPSEKVEKVGSASSAVAAASIAAAERRGYERGYAAGVAWAVECVRPTTVEIPGAALETLGRHPIGQWFADLIERNAGRPRPLTAAPPPSELPNRPVAAVISPSRRAMSSARQQPQADLSPTARKIVDVILSAAPRAITFAAAARRAGASARSSAFRTHKAQVLACAEIEIVEGERLRAAAGYGRPAEPGADPVETWAARLTPSAGAMLRVLRDRRGWVERDALADAAGVSRTSSGLGSTLRELLDLDLIERDGVRFRLQEGMR
jgi:hypothetical protein